MEMLSQVGDEVYLTGITGRNLVAVSSRILELLHKALDKMPCDDMTPEDIFEACMANSMQCWVAYSRDRIVGVMITSILIYPQRKVLGIHQLAADSWTLPKWMPYFERIKDFARAHDCDAIKFWGRPGWEKLLQPDILRIEGEIKL